MSRLDSIPCYTEWGAGCAEVRLGVQSGETVQGALEPGRAAGLWTGPRGHWSGWLMVGFLGAVLGLGRPHPQGMCKCPW